MAIYLPSKAMDLIDEYININTTVQVYDESMQLSSLQQS